jgi:S1-C subfamily serine protease
LTLRDQAPNPDLGFEIQEPRPGSQLADVGVVAGDRLLAIDGQPVSTVPEIQAAIRKHDVGHEMQLIVLHDGEQRRLTATHVHDYDT